MQLSRESTNAEEKKEKGQKGKRPRNPFWASAPPLLVALVLAILLIVAMQGLRRNNPPAERKPFPEAAIAETPLTAKVAFDALVELRASPDGGILKQLDLAELVGNEILENKNTRHYPPDFKTWFPVQLNLAERNYEFKGRRGRGKTMKPSGAHYQGEFAWRDGKWVALAPLKLN